MSKVAGVAILKIDGVQYSLRGNFKLSPANRKRESVVGSDEYHGIKEEPVAPYMEMDITDTGGLDLKALNNFGPGTVTGELINGKVAVLRDAYQVNQMELDVNEGQTTARFEGPSMEIFS